MPEAPLTPDKRTLSQDNDFTPNARAPFIELGLTSCFSFLHGASDAVDLVQTAWQLGYDAIGIADRNTMAGVVRLHTEAKTAKMRPVIGCRIVLATGEAFLAFPRDRAAYGRLCRLVSKGRMQRLDGSWQDKGACDLSLDDLAAHQEGIVLIVMPGEDCDRFAERLPELAQALPSLSHIAASYLYRGDDRARIERLDRLARAYGLAILATNDVHHHVAERRPLQDVMTCIREKTTIAQAGYLLHANAERHLKSPQDMVRLFADWPHAIAASREIADACTFSLDELRYEYPHETVPDGRSADDYLAELAWAGAAGRYPDGTPPDIVATIEKELALIAKMEIARYFLTIHDIVAYARSIGILCQGRGSAANSAVCYCLGITSVDPAKHQVLFERFISEERKEPPDIDVDFEHERREEVIQHIYAKYGRKRAGLCATVIHYRPRMAIREVGKVMGLSQDITAALAKTVWGSWGSSVDDDKVEEAGLDLADPHLKRTIILAEQLIGMPRHLSQHVGGFILTEQALTETVPVGNGAMADRSFIEWDKDDIDALGIFKVDVLALGMLTCIRKCFQLIGAHYDRPLTLASVPKADTATYDMLCKGDSLGVFQVESRAQMNMLPRLKPRCFYDLVIEVAIVRPGPIQGDMVHPYLRRRQGKEKPVYPSPGIEHGPPNELKDILERTLGVPIFQEQAMKIAMVAARFSPDEANQLRRAMATFRAKGLVSKHKAKMVGRMIERGYDPEFAARCFSQIEGFGEYGFPESHAASFAHLVYVSSWLKCHYPAAFACGLLNSQPMGFYAPAQIVRDAREHGVRVLPADVNYSDWDSTLEPVAGKSGGGGFALRLGLRQVGGLAEAEGAKLLAARSAPFASVEELRSRAGLNARSIELLAAADAMRSLGSDRRAALWDARAIKAGPDLPLFSYAQAPEEGADPPMALPAMPLSEHVVADYQTTRLSLKAHPMEFLRQGYAAQGFTRAVDLRSLKFNQRCSVAGVVLIRQRPGSAKGVVFITLEDESGVVNLVVWPDALKRFRKTIMGARLMAVRGYVQMDDDVIHVVAQQMNDDTHRLSELSDDLLRPDYARADHVNKPLQGSWPSNAGRHPRNVTIIPKSRDFH
ncbi:error-prone DNA polymerase [Aurantiacibacter aquimixticola]|uniref:Error-prone DNA polymerase n=1 Tax=Aurantiacibacter aquimixticola TaxID=1958945 RepID=A0A419RUQ4_9SPHN|nr:error-prone DNA polymerase [Aurantiacibacter aquimixticola]RJY09512.1 error-prone DNA polymerase [Aurantiacibacter aquimixticola]